MFFVAWTDATNDVSWINVLCAKIYGIINTQTHKHFSI